jgi:hypothetical protein
MLSTAAPPEEPPAETDVDASSAVCELRAGQAELNGQIIA